VLVVPTRSIQAGLTAAVSYDRRLPGDENAREMRVAMEGVVTGEVTQAVRDSLVDGVQVKAGDFIGLVEDQVVIADPEFERAVEGVSARLVGHDREMLTLLVGDDPNAGKVRAMVEGLRGLYPSLEIEVHEGGQPFYPVLLSAE
jgi:dihydroxyacetone kinase-like predicted kinase